MDHPAARAARPTPAAREALAIDSTSGGQRAGFTVVELVVVIAIVSILSGALAAFMRTPLTAFHDVARRSTLVDVADHALGRLARDVAAALPNSARVSLDGRTLELLHTADGSRYREHPGVNPSPSVAHDLGDALRFDIADDTFNALGRLTSLALGSYPTDLQGYRVAIYPTNTGELYSDAAGGAATGVITPRLRVRIADDGDEDQIQLWDASLPATPRPFKFQYLSPQKRMFLVDVPVTYQCDLAAGRLNRFWGYAIAAAQPTDATAAPLLGASRAPTADHLAQCSFFYQPGTSENSALLTVSLVLGDGSESVRLLRQLHMDNTP